MRAHTDDRTAHVPRLRSALCGAAVTALTLFAVQSPLAAQGMCGAGGGSGGAGGGGIAALGGRGGPGGPGGGGGGFAGGGSGFSPMAMMQQSQQMMAMQQQMQAMRQQQMMRMMQQRQAMQQQQAQQANVVPANYISATTSAKPVSSSLNASAPQTRRERLIARLIERAEKRRAARLTRQESRQ